MNVTSTNSAGFDLYKNLVRTELRFRGIAVGELTGSGKSEGLHRESPLEDGRTKGNRNCGRAGKGDLVVQPFTK
jgi:hypothetical protein